MVGAVVGVQPFGGEGLSGTGPKAGGPLYLLSPARPSPAERWRAPLRRRTASTSSPPLGGASAAARRCSAGRAAKAGDRALARHCERFAAAFARSAIASLLAGPTGERNVYTLQPRDAVLCLGRRRRRSPACSSPRCSRSAAARSGRATRAPLRARLPEAGARAHRSRRRLDRGDGSLRRGPPPRQRRRAASRQRRARVAARTDRRRRGTRGRARRRCRSSGSSSSARSASTPRPRAATRR